MQTIAARQQNVQLALPQNEMPGTRRRSPVRNAKTTGSATTRTLKVQWRQGILQRRIPRDITRISFTLSRCTPRCRALRPEFFFIYDPYRFQTVRAIGFEKSPPSLDDRICSPHARARARAYRDTQKQASAIILSEYRYVMLVAAPIQ